jgi:hypothetical protein
MDDWDLGWDLAGDYGQEIDFEVARDAGLQLDLQAAWQVRFRRSEGFNPEWSVHSQSQGWRREMADRGDLVVSTVKVLDFMKQQHLNLSSFMYAISGHDKAVRLDRNITAARTELLKSPDIIDILLGFYQHGAKWDVEKRKNNPFLRSAIECVRQNVNKEMSALKPVMRMLASEVTVDSLLDICWSPMVEATWMKVPVFWEILQNAATTTRQKGENTLKSLDLVRLLIRPCAILD